MEVMNKSNKFNTGVSSQHCIVVTSEEEFNAWQRGEMILDTLEEKLVPLSAIYKSSLEDLLQRYWGYRDFAKNYNPGGHVRYSKSKCGDEIVTFSYESIIG